MSDGNGDGDFAEYIARERERLHAEREQIFTQQEELQRKLEAVNREFTAIEAYEGGKGRQGSATASAGWPAIASSPRQQAGGAAGADPTRQWAVPRRDSGKDRSEGRQAGRDVGQ